MFRTELVAEYLGALGGRMGDRGAPGGSMSPVTARYGHWVGFVCVGVPPASKMGGPWGVWVY